LPAVGSTACIRHEPLTAARLDGWAGELSTDTEAVALLAEADAIVCLPYGGVVVDDSLAEQLPRLKHVQLLSAGFSEVTPQIAQLRERGISVSNSAYFQRQLQIHANATLAPVHSISALRSLCKCECRHSCVSTVHVVADGGSNAISVAEHAMMLILSVYRRMLHVWANARAGKWRSGLSTEHVLELSGKTVGVIGFGNVGRQLARKLAGFDVHILYHDIVELMPGRDLELSATAVSL
jgi:phosphoglycerate dehydrogenase-like enzyme